MASTLWTKPHENCRAFIGGSDAPIIMGDDEGALVRLWREKRGEAEPEDLSGNLIVQLGRATEEVNELARMETRADVLPRVVLCRQVTDGVICTSASEALP
jgi:predicted phage-related endonuclease